MFEKFERLSDKIMHKQELTKGHHGQRIVA